MKHLSKLFVLPLILFITVSIFSQTPQYYNYNVTGNTNSFPFNIAAGKQIQLLYLPGDFAQPTPAPAGYITTLAFRMAAVLGPYTYTNVVIKMGQTSITSFPASQWYTGQLDTVYSRASVQFGSNANEWLNIPLDRQFLYDPTQSLVIDIQQCGSTAAASTFSTGTTTLSGIRRNASSTTGSCPFTWGASSAIIHHAGINVVPPSTKNFALTLPTPGANTNYVMVPFASGMIGFPNITIEAWMKPGGITTANTVLNKGGASFDYQLGVSATTMVPFFRAQGVIVTPTGITIAAGEWQHLAVTYDGTTCRFYKNGILAYSQVIALPFGSSSNEIRIGRGNADAGSGNLEELRLWSVARTQGQIDSNRCKKFPSTFSSSAGLKALWHLDSTYVDSVSGFNGTPVGTVSFDTVSFPIPGLCTITGISDPVINAIPKDYTLWQNYPNPFNPSTRIEFALPKGEFVEMKLYDLLGKEVAVLVQGPFDAGRHIVDLNLSYLSSGTYFYRITAGGFTDTKKLLLLK